MTPAFVPYDVAIAGAGISGLTCAAALRRAGLRTCVLEAGDRVGGCISSVHRDGCIADGGPQMQFNIIFPRARTYRVWVQFQRNGVVNTAQFTIPVSELK